MFTAILGYMYVVLFQGVLLLSFHRACFWNLGCVMRMLITDLNFRRNGVSSP